MKKLPIIITSFLIIYLFLPGITKAESCHWIGKVPASCSNVEIQDNSSPNKCNNTSTIGICCCPSASAAAKAAAKTTTDNVNYTPLTFYPQIGISSFDGPTAVGSFIKGKMSSNLLATYIEVIYNYGMSVVGILAAIVLMGGGILWLTSAGNDSKITQAKELIGGSIAGLVILFSSWILLNTINPDILKMKPIVTTFVQTLSAGCCESSNKAIMTTDDKCKKPSIFKANARTNSTMTACENEGCCATNNVNSNINTSNYVKCVDTIESDCPAVQNGKTGLKDFFPNQSCSQLGKCPTEVTVNCNSIKDGDSCQNGKGKNVADSYCYGGKCYEGSGIKEGDLCGTNGGKCTSNAGLNFSKLEFQNVNCYESNYQQDSGGRNCGKGLYCCYKKTN
ncbi:MAG: pilin [Patescibacteria group bacterium]|jgi:hypothetical protein